ncbi:MAG: N-acetylneuraminate synthase [Planctomycetota bacterium]|jgi:N,N'-diacetyllegionaminate synthase
MNRTFIIAEAGVNHNGSVETARRMIDVAVTAGVDAVKFQTFRAENVVSVFAPKARYQKETTDKDESQLQMIKRLELDMDSHSQLIDYCRDKGVSFLSSAFDLGSIDVLNGLGLEIFKIPSGEITNLPYLRKIGGLKRKVILSTGMADLDEIRAALDILVCAGTQKEDMTVLQCNTQYPTPIEDANLLAMVTIKEALGVEVGYSDHTIGLEAVIGAVALGARVIEKHFTLDRNMEGPDHKASVEPDELEAMVKAIRNIEMALGDGIKRASKSELENKLVARKSIVAAKEVEAGEVLTEANLAVKRPGTGISPTEWDAVLGKSAKRKFMKDELVEL